MKLLLMSSISSLLPIDFLNTAQFSLVSGHLQMRSSEVVVSGRETKVWNSELEFVAQEKMLVTVQL